MQVQAEASMALRATGLVADDMPVETPMSTLLAAWLSLLWSRQFTPRLFAGTSSLILIAMVSSLLGDPRREYS
ncbi:hypothetical protein PR002_g30203 [Phytophthora rubi]|uniref:Uncharacterized protein n=1 Tax=Phytophthora rubi TaxID=129364 RepID=A0A6A3GU04_9STRA|nr:hypothetical protein PR002_g30203 [Phytophthora rubi]